jgi:carbon monoxide dehydrogenase subunit G
MKLDGSYTFNAPRQAVWTVLQDPEALKKCIPGVEKFEKVGADEYEATMRIGVGAVKGSYTGKIRMFDQQEPSHYKLAVDAKGTPGFVSGQAAFDLAEDGADKTILTWTADGQVGGAVAAVGQRMLGGVAKMTVGQFWKAMDDQIKGS